MLRSSLPLLGGTTNGNRGNTTSTRNPYIQQLLPEDLDFSAVGHLSQLVGGFDLALFLQDKAEGPEGGLAPRAEDLDQLPHTLGMRLFHDFETQRLREDALLDETTKDAVQVQAVAHLLLEGPERLPFQWRHL